MVEFSSDISEAQKNGTLQGKPSRGLSKAQRWQKRAEDYASRLEAKDSELAAVRTHAAENEAQRASEIADLRARIAELQRSEAPRRPQVWSAETKDIMPEIETGRERKG